MGFAPPPDSPPPSEQAGVAADAGFAPSPTGTSLCGFQFPIQFSLNFGVRLPFKFPPFPLPPRFDYFLAFNCDLSNPISANAGFGFGGGRVSTVDPDSDPEYGEDLDAAA